MLSKLEKRMVHFQILFHFYVILWTRHAAYKIIIYEILFGVALTFTFFKPKTNKPLFIRKFCRKKLLIIFEAMKKRKLFFLFSVCSFSLNSKI